VLVYRSTWEGAARRLIRAGLFASCSEQDYLLAVASRIAGSLYRARVLARYAEQTGIWASSWPSPEQQHIS
ncbi:hypothetical protein A2U01_0039511, partial [Trifolium medium]|nr:hypothetical protein [Trifolium medium]